MKRGGKIEICVLIGVLLGAASKAAVADTTSRPYDGIVERNVFNLHPPAPVVNPADLIPKTPPPKITLTGITTILGRKLTFLTTPGSKPGALPESVALAEGQAQNDIEVKTIDEKAGIVKVINHGESQTLDFEHDGAKPSGPPAGAAPNATMFPPPSLPPPNISSPQPGNIIRPLRSLPTRPSPFSNSGNGSPFGGGLGAANNGNGQNEGALSREEQVALIEIQRVKYQQENNPIHRILPPTEMSGETMNNAPQ